MKLPAILLIALVAPGVTASECMSPLSVADSRVARSAFVFQVVSAEYRRGAESPLGDFALAKLRVVDTLRGGASSHMSYYLEPRCGPKIAVGSFYAAFLPRISGGFVGSASNLVVIGQTYSPTTDRRLLKSLLRGRAAGQALLDSSWARLTQIPPPPAPCPVSGLRHEP